MLALLLAATFGTSPPTNAPICAQYYHAACSEALGEWLPRFADSWFLRGDAKLITRMDGFVYEGKRAPSPDMLGLLGPDDGTFFVYGDAGPPKGDVVYDYARNIVFYDQGCCSWHESVAGYTSAPPKRVVNRDLSTLRTERGIRLGMSPSDVEAIYGANTLRPLQKVPGVSVLGYSTELKIPTVQSPCGQDDNFYFRGGRLVLIQIGNAC